MSAAHRANYVSRDAILKLMSNDEIAKVSTAEAAAGLKAEGEFFDLEHLGDGIHQNDTAAPVTLDHAAFLIEAWNSILAQMAVQP
jgi:hypothetical protein